MRRPACARGRPRSRRPPRPPTRTCSCGPKRNGSATPSRCAPPPPPPTRRCSVTRPRAPPSAPAPPPRAGGARPRARRGAPPSLADRLSEASYLLADVAGELASYTEALDADPARLASVQERRATLGRLVRTYGP